MLGAVMYGHKNFQGVIDLIIGLAEICAKEPRDLPPEAYDRKALQAKLKSLIGADITAAYKETVKQDALHQAWRWPEEGDQGPFRRKKPRAESRCRRSRTAEI